MSETNQKTLNAPDLMDVENKTNEEVTTEIALSPLLRGAATTISYTDTIPKPDLTEAIKILRSQVALTHAGDLTLAENILIAQANTLDAIFNNLATRAVESKYIDNEDRLLRLALKAQAQCARTLQTLSAIKNPPSVAFVKQANIGNAVQVNNSLPETKADLAIPTQASILNLENNFLQNELLEQANGQRLDARTPHKAILTN